jgi:hypothetical protein
LTEVGIEGMTITGSQRVWPSERAPETLRLKGTKTFSPQRHRGHKVRKENKSLPNPLRFGAEIPRKCLTFPILIECHGEEL